MLNLFTNSKKISDFAAVTCFFNFSDSELRRRAYNKFVKKIKRQGVELYTIELIYEKRKPFTRGGDHCFHLHTDSILWSKENLLNILIKKLPKRIKKVAWLDADIILENDNWPEEASEKLNHSPIVQLASTMERADKTGQVYEYRMSIAKGYARNHRSFANIPVGPWSNPHNSYHPGMAWSATRKFLSKVGLYEYDIVGGGDVTMFFCFVSENMMGVSPAHSHVWGDHHESIFSVVNDYNNKAFSYVKGHVDYISGDIRHIWHGGGKKGCYRTRHSVTKKINFWKDLKKNNEGLLIWANKDHEQSFKDLIIKQDSV